MGRGGLCSLLFSGLSLPHVGALLTRESCPPSPVPSVAGCEVVLVSVPAARTGRSS